MKVKVSIPWNTTPMAAVLVIARAMRDAGHTEGRIDRFLREAARLGDDGEALAAVVLKIATVELVEA